MRNMGTDLFISTCGVRMRKSLPIEVKNMLGGAKSDFNAHSLIIPCYQKRSV